VSQAIQVRVRPTFSDLTKLILPSVKGRANDFLCDWPFRLEKISLPNGRKFPVGYSMHFSAIQSDYNGM